MSCRRSRRSIGGGARGVRPVGFEGATVAAIRAKARASNGSFFHVFGSKKELAGALFLEVLRHYHAAMLAALDGARRASRASIA